MEIAFLMDDLRQIDPVWDTTAQIMYECNQRGHEVFFLEPHDIYVRKNEVVARMRYISVPGNQPLKKYWAALICCLNREELIFETVTDLDVLFLRKDPPLNHEALEFLGPVSDQVFMVNNTLGQLSCCSKAYILNFPDIIPETHVSRDPSRLRKIIDDFGGAMVIKPLHGHGGHGVIKVSNEDQENLNSLINYYVRAGKPYPERQPIMVQEYLRQVKEEGDVRILLLDGEILGAMGRKSLSGDFRTNVHAGAMAFKHEITPAQKEICRRIKPKLRQDGLYFVGIDIIGDKLVEINCISPGGIPRINRFNNQKLEIDVVNFIEEKISGAYQKKATNSFKSLFDRRWRFSVFPMMMAFVILGLAAAGLFSCGGSKEPPFLKIGLPEEPRSLNLWLGTDANSRNILSQIYQPLFRRHPETLEMIPWLAKEDAVFNEKELTYTVKLREAKWSDGSDFSSADVLFTRQLFADFKIPRYHSHWQVVEKAEALDDHTVVFHLKEPSAVFLPRVMTAPMVSKKEWEPVCKEALATEKPLRYLQDYQVENPLGTGPFMLHEYQKGAYIHMVRNPHFFGQGKTIGSLTLGPYVDHILFNIYGTSDVAILALKKGDIDYYWWDIQPGYLNDLEEDSDIDLHFNKKSALYYLGFNLRKPPFNDKTLRHAVATVVDKGFILDRILQNHGNPMHSIVPAGNRFWHNPDVRKYGEGMDQETRIKTAFQVLADAGYSWETPPVAPDGSLTKPSDIRLPSGEKMEKFVILTPPADYDPKRAFAGTMIQEWLRQLGMPAFARPMAFNSLLETVKGKHDFDAFVLGYGKLDLDPGYLAPFFSSKNDNPRDWNMSGYRNPAFDKLAEMQKRTVDVQARKQMIFDMQALLLEDVPYYPLYNPHIIEATVNKRFTGWVERVDGIGNIWSLCMVKPVD